MEYSAHVRNLYGSESVSSAAYGHIGICDDNGVYIWALKIVHIECDIAISIDGSGKSYAEWPIEVFKLNKDRFLYPATDTWQSWHSDDLVRYVSGEICGLTSGDIILMMVDTAQGNKGNAWTTIWILS